MRTASGLTAGWGVLMALGAMSAHAADVWQNVDQGWSAASKQQWHTLSQGSRLIPRDWLFALEQKDSDRPFLQRAHTESFRYLTDASTDPALPLGFVLDTQSDKNFSEVTKLTWKTGQGDKAAWVGMNCAACHTNDITFQGKRMRIEGAPALADFQGYMRALKDALTATRQNPDKWNRFAARVLVNADDAGNRKALADSLTTLLDWQLRVADANATDLDYGFARVDAFGHIYNKVLLRSAAANQPRNPSDAPVSYPFLWNIHQHDKVQWNGSAPNLPLGEIDIGALGRNVGEVIGVFADLSLRGPSFETGLNGYPTSARVKNLLALEKLITTLKPPAWPAAFPPIDANRWEAGKTLFANACASCHEVLARNNLTTKFKVTMTPLFGDEQLGTDPWMACNAYSYQASTGVLKNTPRRFFIGIGGPLYKETGQLSDMLGTAVIGAMYNRKDEIINAALSAKDLPQTLVSAKFFELHKLSQLEIGTIKDLFETSPPPVTDKDERLKRCMAEKDLTRLAYKGRPLTGIWATPPYLHNGSVPTLYDLLLPPAQRPVSFTLGTREFDPVKVGYVSDATLAPYQSDRARLENSFTFNTRDPAGHIIAGNSNLGHDYGNARFTEDERLALVEYMKAVGASRAGNKIVP